jgi:hypothetical protein
MPVSHPKGGPPWILLPKRDAEWCLYNGQSTYAKDCPYTRLTGLECSMNHKECPIPDSKCDAKWCLYNGQNTYAEDCLYTHRTGVECSMNHKE